MQNRPSSKAPFYAAHRLSIVYHALRFQLALLCGLFFTQAHSMDLKDALELGLKVSPEYQNQLSKSEQAKMTHRQYWGELFPKIQAKGNYETRRDVATSRFTDPTNKESYLAALELSQPLFAGGALTAGLQLGKLEVQLAEQETLLMRQTLVRQIFEAYANVIHRREELQAAETYRALLKTYVEVTGRYASIGRSRDIDNLQSQINFELLSLDVEELKKDLTSSQQKLAALLKTEIEPTKLQMPPDSAARVQLPSVEDSIKRAGDENPSVAALTLSKQMTHAKNRIALSTDLPSLNLYAQVGYLSPQSDDLWMDRQRFEKVGLNLTIPLFSGLTSLAKRQSQSESLFQADRSIEIAKRDLDQSVRELHLKLKLQKDQLQAVQKILEKSRRAYEIANRGYTRGTVSNQDMVNFQRNLYDSEKLMIRKRFEFEKSLLAFREALGTDLLEVYSQ